MLDLLYSTQSPEIQQASLYTLGCASENNGKAFNCVCFSEIIVCLFLAELEGCRSILR